MRKSKEELEVLRGWPSKDKTPYKGGTVRRLRMKKKKNIGKKATKWQDTGKRSKIWMTRLKDKEWKEVLKVGYLAKSP